MMKNETSFTLTKQIFFAWSFFKQTFSYTREFNRFWYKDNPYNLNIKAVHATLHEAIESSSLPENLKTAAWFLIFRRYTKKELITQGVATIKDFDTIRLTLASSIGRHTHCEQEKRYLEDFLKNRFDHPTRAPFLLLDSPFTYEILSHLLDNQDVLTKDEEALLSLFLLGETTDNELTDAQRLIILDAVHKLEDIFCRSNVEFYKQVAEIYVKFFPTFNMMQLCEAFNLNYPRFRLFCNRYSHRMERRKKLKDFLDE